MNKLIKKTQIIIVTATLVFSLFGCSQNPKNDCIQISDDQVFQMINIADNLYRQDAMFSQSLNSFVPLTTKQDLASVTDDEIPFNNFRANGEAYQFAVLQYDDAINRYDFIVLCKTISDQDAVVGIFTVDKKYDCSEIDGTQDAIVYINGYKEPSETATIKYSHPTPTILRRAYPKILKNHHLYTMDEGYPLPKTAYVFLTDQGFTCVYYDANGDYEGKLLLDEPELQELYRQYVRYFFQ